MNRMARNVIHLLLAMVLLGLAAWAQTQPVSNSQNSTTPNSSLGDYARQVKKDTSHKPRTFDNDNLPKDDKLSIVGSTDNTSTSEEPAPPASEESSAPKSDQAAAEKPAESSASGETKTESKSAKENHASPEGKPKPAASAGSSAEAESKPEPKPEAPTAEAKSAAPAPATSSDTNKEAGDKQAEWKQWGEKINSQKDQIDLAERELNVLQREYQIRAAAMYGDAGNRLRNQADWDKQDAQYKQQIADKQKALEDAKGKLDDMQEDARRAGVPESVREPE